MIATSVKEDAAVVITKPDGGKKTELKKKPSKTNETKRNQNALSLERAKTYIIKVFYSRHRGRPKKISLSRHTSIKGAHLGGRGGRREGGGGGKGRGEGERGVGGGKKGR